MAIVISRVRIRACLHERHNLFWGCGFMGSASGVRGWSKGLGVCIYGVGLGFAVWVHDLGSGFRVQGSGIGAYGWAWGSGLRAEGFILGLMAEGLGLRV